MFNSALQHALSFLVGKIAFCRVRWFKNLLIKLFIHAYPIDMQAVKEPDINQYPTFNAFFVRKLKPDVRPIDATPSSIVSPVDGTVSQMGSIHAGGLVQAKGVNYSLESLVTPHFPLQDKFKQGLFATLYLAPSDYHRVHMPMEGVLKQMWYVPGELFSVNAKSVIKTPRLFARNERVVTLFDTPAGWMILIFVGAMLVRSIVTAWEGIIVPSRSREIKTWDYHGQTLTFKKGEEIGFFQYGSTVILLFENNKVAQFADKSSMKVELGQKLWYII